MRSSSLLLLGLTLPFAGAAPSASGETLTVTTLHDVRDFGGARRVADLPGPDGRVSFGEAVTAANNEPGPQTIHFAIPRSEYWLIQEIALLELEIGPFMLTDDGTTIDFRTQTAFAGDTNPDGWEVGIYGLEPNGWGAGAILVGADDCTLIGLDDVFQRGYAVDISGNRNRVLSFTTSGPLHAAIRVEGAFGFYSATGNVIGGTGPGEGNVVSGGDAGISIACPADDNVVIGNTCIGSPNIGIQVIGATQYDCFARNNRIGGPTLAERNWVAANGSYGEEGFPLGTQISVVDADDTLIEGNFVGTTANGMADYPVQIGPTGIVVRNARGTTVRGNLVSGILQVGTFHAQGRRFGTAISVIGTCADTRILGNRVGTDLLGVNPIPNVAGIFVGPFTSFDRPLRTSIGGLLSGEANTVAFSETAGIQIDSLVSSVAIRGNRIFSNGALGIDLFTFAGAGVTLNDLLDADEDGGNHLQNFPVLSRAVSAGSSLLVTGRLASTPLEVFALDFFASPARDPSGFGEGAVFLGTRELATDAQGRVSFATGFTGVPPGWFVSATATRSDLGDTSEFSAAVRVARAQGVH